jgi:predicted transcriptional regulator
MYLLPQEIEVWYIIPAIRKELSRLFVKKYGLTLEKAGSILGISKAAVSQYLSNKRANKLKLNAGIKKELVKSSKIIMEDNKKAIREIQRVLKIMKEKKCECEVCEKYNPEIKGMCKSAYCK